MTFLTLVSFAAVIPGAVCCAQAVPFAHDGLLKMLYDSRMHPQAVEHEGKIYIVWRGEKGRPYLRSSDLESREFSEPVMVLDGFEDRLKKAAKYPSDHHFCPVLWIDAEERFHVLSGCHGNKPSNYTSGDHVRSVNPGDLTRWEMMSTPINVSVNYPKAHRIFGDRTLVYFRDGGHLAACTEFPTIDKTNHPR